MKTTKEKYGATTFWGSKKILIDDCEMSLMNWWRKLPEPKISYSNLCLQVKSLPSVTLSSLERILKNHKQNKSSLEAYAERLFETDHYNKTPKILKELHRPDFKLSNKIYVNVDGLYWHSELQRDKWYHFNLRKSFEDINLRLFQIREDEIYQKSHIVKSIINNALGETSNKLYARKCQIKPVKQKESSLFLNKNHLMGSTNAKHIGLYYKDELVSILSYKQRKNVCKIERFCSKINCNVIGGFNKLLTFLIKNCLKQEITEIHNWVDLRYGTGTHLGNKGFELVKETLGWKWTDGKETYNRLRCRANMDDRRLTQKEHAEELKWVKIYDAGQRLYVKHIK